MKLKIILWLALLLPTFANAQWFNGVIQRDNTSTWIRYLQGANQVRLALYSDLPSGTDFIQNQSASAQTASSWITGSHIIGTNPSAFGAIRLPNNTGIFWRNAANTNNLGLTLNSSDVLITSANISVGSVTSSTIGSNVIAKANGSGTLVAAVSNTDYLPVSSPAMTGTPTAPTATGGTNTTQIATTAFVQDALSGLGTNYITTNTGQSGLSGNKTTSGAWVFNTSSGTSIKSTTTDASNPGSSFDNTSGPITHFKANNVLRSSIINNGGFNWDQATATTTAGWDASKNLVSITNTGTGSAVRATSPTLVTPNIGVASGTSLTLTGATSTPLSVQTDAGGNGISIARSNGANALIFIGGGNAAGSAFNVGVGPTNSFGLNGSGSFYISALGTGSVIASAGVLSVSSDSRIKNVRGPFKGSALKAINNIPLPKYWEYNKKSGLPKEAQEVKQFGLLADKIHPILGEEFAPTQKDGTYSLSDRALLSLTIQALQEATKRIEELEYKLNKP